MKSNLDKSTTKRCKKVREKLPEASIVKYSTLSGDREWRSMATKEKRDISVILELQVSRCENKIIESKTKKETE